MEDSRSKKTVRQFNCRDALWTIFEEMARELECSVDYLINEAMRQYAKSRRYAVPAAEQPGAGVSGPVVPIPGGQPAVTPPSSPTAGLPPRPPRPTGQMPAAPPLRPSPLPAAPPPVAGQPAMPPRPLAPGSAPSGRQSLFPLDARATSPVPIVPTPADAAAPGMAPETDAFARLRRAAPTPAAPVAPPHAAAPGTSPSFEVAKVSTGQGNAPLYIVFNGQRIPVRKEQFIIGRGLKTSDLAIKDTNISRRHAAVLFHNGAYYIKDLNSTNGIEYNGMRIDSKRIEEGDSFKICDYEFRFTYQG